MKHRVSCIDCTGTEYDQIKYGGLGLWLGLEVADLWLALALVINQSTTYHLQK